MPTEMKRLSDVAGNGPIARAESVVGDRWTVLVLRELFMLISEPSAAYIEERNARREAFKGNRIQQ